MAASVADDTVVAEENAWGLSNRKVQQRETLEHFLQSSRYAVNAALPLVVGRCTRTALLFSGVYSSRIRSFCTDRQDVGAYVEDAAF